jgi:hypothetical protein
MQRTLYDVYMHSIPGMPLPADAWLGMVLVALVGAAVGYSGGRLASRYGKAKKIVG